MSFTSWKALIIVVLVIITGVSLLTINSDQGTRLFDPSAGNFPPQDKQVMGTNTGRKGDSMREVEVTVTARNFSYSMPEIRVQKGEKVRLTLNVEQGMHDWGVDEFGARTKVIQTGQTDTIEFVADRTGNFEYYCSVGTHRAMGMVGKLIVE
jgi:plastocyanin